MAIAEDRWRRGDRRDRPYWRSWRDLVFRWFHVDRRDRLDRHLVLLRRARPAPASRARTRTRERGVGGESWEIHGGGFYRIEKFRVAPPQLPEPLHWFKWEAYTTWLSGLRAARRPLLRRTPARAPDRSVRRRHARRGRRSRSRIGGLAARVARLRRALPDDRPTERAAARRLRRRRSSILPPGAPAQLFAPRAAYLQVGAMLGTIMAANVFFVIIPAHWKLVRAKEAGREPDPAANRARQAALGAQQLPHPARALHDARRALPVHVRRTSTPGLILVCLMVDRRVDPRSTSTSATRAGRSGGSRVTAAAGIAAVAVCDPAPDAAPADDRRRRSASRRSQPIVAQRCAPVPLAAPDARRAAPPGDRARDRGADPGRRRR